MEEFFARAVTGGTGINGLNQWPFSSFLSGSVVAE